jgi:flagellar hook protein FlgE
MFQALFNSLSGLFSFSRSLDTVSNNIANMNTPGFRGSDSFFENVSGGRGTSIAGEGLRTTPGDIRQTGTPTHVAIDGEGFFILRDDNGNLFYTRAGEFRFNSEGFLEDSVTHYKVMASDADGILAPIDLDNYRTRAAVATSNINLRGNIAPGSNSYTIPDGVKIFSSTGGEHTLAITLVAELDADGDPTGNFKVTVKEGNTVIASNQMIKYDSLDHTPVAGFNTIALSMSLDGSAQTVTLNFGTPGDLQGGTRSQPGLTTTLTAPEAGVDGHGELGIASLSFDEKGVLKIVYSATEKLDGPQLALARFPSESDLELLGGRLVSGDNAVRTIGHPGDPNFGKIQGGALELANVDLTQEFADMIIIQRGYQASSRVMTVSNEMIEQLYNSTRGG